MNKSTIIMPCNTSFTDPNTTLGWGVVDFDWSNAKDLWAKHTPMDDEEMLMQQVQMTTSATPGTTVWIYRCSVYAYPWYTAVRKLLDDEAYEPWFVRFKPQGPYNSPKCTTYVNPAPVGNLTKCSDLYHCGQACQTPGFQHGDGSCAAPGCDCGKQPCGFYLWNHSSTAVVHGQTFQDWFVNDYMLNKIGMSHQVSGFFWDDFWPSPGGRFPDSPNEYVVNDTGLAQDYGAWGQITDAYHDNMDVLRSATLKAGKFAWQLAWSGGSETSVGSTVLSPIVTPTNCAATLRRLCSRTAPPQTRAMLYGLSCNQTKSNFGNSTLLTALGQDIANFLLIRGQPISISYIAPLFFFKMTCKQNLDLRCVLVSAPWVLGTKHVSNPE